MIRVMLIGGLAVLTLFSLTILSSLGRLDQQDKQIQSCRVQGKLAFLGSGQHWDENGSSALGTQYIALCMDKAGYSFNFEGVFCQPEMDGSEFSNKYCYRSKGFEILTEIDIAMNGGFENWPSQLWCERMRTITKAYCISHGWFPS